MDNRPLLAIGVAIGLQWVWQPAAMASEFTLGDLRERSLSAESIEGRFTQCTIHGDAKILASGTYRIEPGKLVKLVFEKENPMTMIFLDDGSQRISHNGEIRESTRNSFLGKLIFSIMSLDQTYIGRKFFISLHGNIDRFKLSLTPKRGMKGTIRSIEVFGSEGLPNAFKLLTRDKRKILFHLFSNEKQRRTECK